MQIEGLILFVRFVVFEDCDPMFTLVKWRHSRVTSLSMLNSPGKYKAFFLYINGNQFNKKKENEKTTEKQSIKLPIW
jgi:hypothetical protein